MPRRSTLVDRIAQIPFEPKGGESMLKAKNELLGPNEDLSSEQSQCWGQDNGGQPRPQSSTRGARGPFGSQTMSETSSETENHRAQLPIDGSSQRMKRCRLKSTPRTSVRVWTEGGVPDWSRFDMSTGPDGETGSALNIQQLFSSSLTGSLYSCIQKRTAR